MGKLVWVFRWKQTLPDGTRATRQKVIGTPERYKDRAAAESAAGGLRLMANADGPNQLKVVTMEALIQLYRTTEVIDNGEEGKFLLDARSLRLLSESMGTTEVGKLSSRRRQDGGCRRVVAHTEADTEEARGKG